jgi:D-alanine-D-alanine ligase
MKTRVAVVYGGRSGEHEISLRSAKSIMEALDPEKYKIIQYFISPEGKWRPRPIVPEPGGNSEIDVVFPVLHGTFGEDGTIQGLLEMAELPYVSAGVLASAVSMDKEVMKRLCRERGIPVVDYVTIFRESMDIDEACAKLHFPMFVKPANLGSSVGVAKVNDRRQLEAAVASAAQYDRKIVVEQGVTGREFECSVMGNASPEASVPCEIHPSREFYDYEDKYLLDKAVIELPAKLSAAQTAEMQRLAVDCYRAVECEVMARVDFLMDAATGQIFVNEINTIPGFTSISMFPKMWEHGGISYAQLIDRLIGLALERAGNRKANRYQK